MRIVSLLFFHLRDGHDILLDPEGRELDGGEATVAAALAEARAIISNDAMAGCINLNQDEHKNIVHCLRFDDAIQLVLPQPELVAGR